MFDNSLTIANEKKTLSVQSFPHVPDATPDQLCLLLFATKAFGLPQTTSSCIYPFSLRNNPAD